MTTDPETTESSIGEALRRLREERRISVRTLAAQSGFSPSFISQIENEQASPSISSLEKIVGCLAVTLAQFFNSLEPTAAAVTRSSERRRLNSEWSKATIESLSPSGHAVWMTPLLITLQVGGCSGKHTTASSHHEFLFVLQGELFLTFGVQDTVLRAGDSATIPAGQPRKYKNKGPGATQIIIVSIQSQTAASVKR